MDVPKSFSFDLKKLFAWLFTLYLLLGMHFFMHNPGGAGLYLPFNIIGWIFVPLLISCGLWQVTHKKTLVISRFHLVSWLVFLLLLIPALYPNAADKGFAFPRLLGLAAGLLLYFSLLQFRFNGRERRFGLTLILAAVAIEVLLGLVQYFLLTPGNWLGYNTINNRPYGIFQQPNVMASFVASGVVVSLYLLAQLPGRRWRLGLYVLHGIVIIGGALLLVVLQSRTGQLGVICGVLLLMPLAWRRSKVRCRWWLLALMTGMMLGVAAYYGVAGNKRGGTIYTQPGGRSVIYQQTWQMIEQHPLLGVGYGNYERAFLEQYAKDTQRDPGQANALYNLDHPHNELLYWTVEGGVLSLAGLVLLMAAYLRLLWRGNWRQSLALLGLILPILLHSETEYPLYASVVHWVLFIVFLYLADVSLGDLEARSFQPKLVLRMLAVLIPLLVVPFMLTTLQAAYLVTKYERGGHKDPKLLTDIINPIGWISQVEFDAMNIRLFVGMKLDRPQDLKAYYDWASQYVKHRPRAILYFNMVRALNKLGEIEKAKQTLAYARYLYVGVNIFDQLTPSGAMKLKSPSGTLPG